MNINYHVEHHDFPEIPCRYLPQINKIAGTFYNNLNKFNDYPSILKCYYRSNNWFYAGYQNAKTTTI